MYTNAFVPPNMYTDASIREYILGIHTDASIRAQHHVHHMYIMYVGSVIEYKRAYTYLRRHNLSDNKPSNQHRVENILGTQRRPLFDTGHSRDPPVMKTPQEVHHLLLREGGRVRVQGTLAADILVAMVPDRLVERVRVEVLFELRHEQIENRGARSPRTNKYEASTFLFLHMMKTKPSMKLHPPQIYSALRFGHIRSLLVRLPSVILLVIVPLPNDKERKDGIPKLQIPSVWAAV